MTVTLSRDSLHALLGQSPTEAKWAVVAHEHVRDRPHELWLGILLDLRRCYVRFYGDDGVVPPPYRLLELADRVAQVKRRNRYAWRF